MKNEENTQGLPLAVQIVSFPNREDVVLSVMKKLETIATLRKNYPINSVLKDLFQK